MNILKNRPIPVKTKVWPVEYSKCIEGVKLLRPVIESVGMGDCVEVDFNPECVRRHLAELKIELVIRQIDLHTFRIWRK